MTLVASTWAVPSPASAQTVNGVSYNTYAYWTDYFAERASMGTFQYYENRNGTSSFSYLNWTDDGCSVPFGLSWIGSFHNPCERHDFCYRNNSSSRLNRRGFWQKWECDTKFNSDMSNACSSWSWYNRWWCHESREAYYDAVVLFGRIN